MQLSYMSYANSNQKCPQSPLRTQLSTLKRRVADTHDKSLTRPMLSVSIATKRGISLQTAGQREGERKVNAQKVGRVRAKEKGNPQRQPMWLQVNLTVHGWLLQMTYSNQRYQITMEDLM